MLTRTQSRGQATLDHPPESKHFDKAACITSSTKNTSQTPALGPAVPPAVVAPAPVSAPSSSTSDLINLLVVGMLQQQQAALAPKPIVAADPVALPAAPAPLVSSALASAPTALAAPSGSLVIPNVSLDDFCARYSIELKDRERLEKMEFRPGDNIKNLEADEWRLFGGFPALSWGRIKGKNQEFLCDVQLGIWED